MTAPAPVAVSPLAEADLRRFVDTEYPRVVAAVAMVTGERASAEDAVQDAMVRAWQHGDPIRNVGAWVTVAATNQALGQLRSRRAERRALRRLGARAARPAHETGSVTELDGALARLSVRQRQAVVLHYYLDRSVRECAVALGVSEGTVKTLLHRARRSLAELLGADGEEA